MIMNFSVIRNIGRNPFPHHCENLWMGLEIDLGPLNHSCSFSICSATLRVQMRRMGNWGGWGAEMSHAFPITPANSANQAGEGTMASHVSPASQERAFTTRDWQGRKMYHLWMSSPTLAISQHKEPVSNSWEDNTSPQAQPRCSSGLLSVPLLAG